MSEDRNKEQPYREGDQETGDEKISKTPITAFLVLMSPEGIVDVVTELPGLEVQRKPSAQDVRNMARTVFDDAQVQILMVKSTSGIARSLAGVLTSVGRQPQIQNLAGPANMPPGMMPGVPPGVIPNIPPGMVPPGMGAPVATPDLSQRTSKKDKGDNEV